MRDRAKRLGETPLIQPPRTIKSNLRSDKNFLTAEFPRRPGELSFPVLLVGVGIAARIAAEVGGRWAALVGGLLLALSPIEVQYGQEARSYTLVSAAILLSLWGLVRLAGTPGQTVPEQPPEARRASRGQRAPRRVSTDTTVRSVMAMSRRRLQFRT